MSQPYPITGIEGGVYTRLELRDLAKNPIQWSLFIQAMTKLQSMSATEPNGWWQMGSIHGLPYTPFSGDPNGPQTADKNSQWGGYCYHGSALFPPWHRILLLLIEQAMVNEAVAIASGLNDDKWLQAAGELRFPYWDWTRAETAEEGIPKLCQLTKVQIATVNGSTVEVDNPLNHYKYTGKFDQPAQGAAYMNDWTRTYRWANRDVDPTVEQYNLAQQAFANGGSFTMGSEQVDVQPLHWIRAKVAALFTYDLTVTDPGYGGNMWGYFSGTGAQDDKVDPVMDPMPPSLEEPHNQIHLHVGGNGSMSMNEYAGYDPIFFLHHCNVDRLYAFWEYLYPQYHIGYGWKSKETGKIVPFVTDSGTYYQDSGSTVDETTPFHPFRNKDLDYWTDVETQSLLSTSKVNKYYTYPPITDPRTGFQIKVDVPYNVNDLALRERYRQVLYNEFSPDHKAIVQQHLRLPLTKLLSNKLLVKEENGISHLRHFYLVGEVPEFMYRGSYRLELYMLPKDRNQTQVHVINSITVLGRADPDRCAACVGRRAAGNHVRGHMPLDPRLILHLIGRLGALQLAAITHLDHVASLIHGSFGMRLVKPDGTNLAAADPATPTHLDPLHESKIPKVTLHSHVIQFSRDPAAPIRFVDRTHHGAFGRGIQWRVL